MLIEGVIGFGICESSGWPTGISVLFAVFSGCVAGWQAWVLKLAMVFLIGACLGGLVVGAIRIQRVACRNGKAKCPRRNDVHSVRKVEE